MHFQNGCYWGKYGLSVIRIAKVYWALTVCTFSCHSPDKPMGYVLLLSTYEQNWEVTGPLKQLKEGLGCNPGSLTAGPWSSALSSVLELMATAMVLCPGLCILSYGLGKMPSLIYFYLLALCSFICSCLLNIAFQTNTLIEEGNMDLKYNGGDIYESLWKKLKMLRAE